MTDRTKFTASLPWLNNNPVPVVSVRKKKLFYYVIQQQFNLFSLFQIFLPHLLSISALSCPTCWLLKDLYKRHSKGKPSKDLIFSISWKISWIPWRMVNCRNLWMHWEYVLYPNKNFPYNKGCAWKDQRIYANSSH